MIEVDEVPVVLSRSESGEVCAIDVACTLQGEPLAEGEREGDVVTCPWHGSRFDLFSGEVVRHEIRLYLSGRADCYEVEVDGRRLPGRMGPARVLGLVRKAFIRVRAP